MFKKFWLKYQTKRHERNRTTESAANFQNSTKIGIFFSSDTQFSEENIDKIIKELNADGKEIFTLVFCKSKKEYLEGFECFDSSCIGALGNCKSDSLRKFTETDFDFLINLDGSSHFMATYLFSIAKAKCRVGLFSNPTQPSGFEMIIKTQANGSVKPKEILSYLKMIRS